MFSVTPVCHSRLRLSAAPKVPVDLYAVFLIEFFTEVLDLFPQIFVFTSFSSHLVLKDLWPQLFLTPPGIGSVRCWSIPGK